MIPRLLQRDSLRPRRSGAALVIVLFVIVLVIGLVVAFLNAVKTERVSTANFLASSEVRKLADNVVGVVESQINYAVTRGTNTAWASQPGMIRTYKQSGSFDTAYKLYSAQTLTATSATALTNDLPPADWRDSPAVWADLNAPVTVDGVTNFPIFDPMAALDPDAAKRVKGITITAAPGTTAEQPAPMPVRWLYVLQNGQMVSPTGSGKSITVANADATNPIVGRVAFWADDDTCKININTAGTGSYWDTPHFNTTEERKFASSQPLNGEFQRYPGHPAMTDLTTVFPMLTAEDILKKITPRYQWGGSEQGTKDTYTLTNALAGGQLADKPLFASVDEIGFLSDKSGRMANAQMDRSTLQKAKFFLTATSRAPELNLFNLPRIACWPISTDSAAGRTAFDQVIAFCSTISGNPYYFQRQNALSPTEDADIARNIQLFTYLQKLSNQPTPGFGVSLNGKFGADTDQVLTEIWDYIRSTNLYDSRLSAGKSFTADPSGGSTKSGHGYVVPLEVASEGVSYLGFGRSFTLSELAFLFICTADSVDIATTPDPLGLLKSNDPAENRTLNGAALNATQKERRIQLMLVPELFSPSLGDVQIAPKNFRVQISGLSSLRLNGGEALFSNDSATLTVLDKGFNEGLTHVRRAGGQFDYRAFLRCDGKPLRSPLSWDSGSSNIYPFISNPVTVSVTGSPSDPGSMTFSAGALTVTIESSVNGASWDTVQTIQITPPASSAIPVPNLVRTGGPSVDGGSLATDSAHWWAFSLASPMTNGTSGGRLNGVDSGPNAWKLSGGVPYMEDGIRSASLFRGRDSASSDPPYTDVVRSMVPSHGDYRLIAALKDVPVEAFTPLGNWSAGGAQNALIHTLALGLQRTSEVAGNSKFRRHFVTSSPIGSSSSTAYGAGGAYAPDFRSDASAVLINAIATSGDFDNPSACWPDGAFINKPDEGNIYSSTGNTPYFVSEARGQIDSKAFFSPNRMIPGPGMFGSLPTHVRRYLADASHPETYAWRSLLFRKQPTHPNSVNFVNGLPDLAPDHLIMDLFWMPTVEPYAISEPFATAGKINMNYQIQPFTYIVRKTAMLAVLKNEKIPAIPSTANATYKSSMTATPVAASYRQDIDANVTLEQFDSRFDEAKTTGRIFLSPSELCDLWLVPSGMQATDSSMQSFWPDYKLTGDNLRERPYTDLIPRLTTKSNTYTVHFRVQRLKTADPAKWEENQNAITAEYRGSTTIERFLDPNATYPDYAPDPTVQPGLDSFYRWRTVENRQFSP